MSKEPTDPLAAARALMAKRGVEVIDLTKLGCGYRVKKGEGYWHQREKRHYDEWPNATEFDSESAAILAWLEAEQPAAKPQPAGYSVDDERILVQWRDADGYDHSITIDADEAVYRIDADGIHEFIREWPLPKQPADPDLPMCIAELEKNTHD
jgi:hypothetical protein